MFLCNISWNKAECACYLLLLLLFWHLIRSVSPGLSDSECLLVPPHGTLSSPLAHWACIDSLQVLHAASAKADRYCDPGQSSDTPLLLAVRGVELNLLIDFPRLL